MVTLRFVSIFREIAYILSWSYVCFSQNAEFNPFSGLFGNPVFWMIIALCGAVQVLIVEFGGQFTQVSWTQLPGSYLSFSLSPRLFL